MKEKLTPFQRHERIHGFLFGKKPKRRLFNFEIHLNDECNLSCRGCFHFAPLVHGKSPYPIEEFAADLKRIGEIFHGKFGWVHLLGGEPLLNENVIRYLDIARQHIKKGTIDLVTNGLLLPKMKEDFFEACRRNHIRVAITRYPIPLDYDKLLSLVRAHGCEGYVFGDRTASDSFSLPALDPKSKTSSKRNYLHCILANACVTLDHGKLTYCSLPGYVRLFNDAFGHTFDDEGDWISIYGHNKKEILDFLRTPHPFCRYCDLEKRFNNLIPWSKSEGKKEEWLS